MPGDHVVQERGIQHGPRDGADLVERGGERDRAVAADAAVGGLDADRAGDAAGWRIEPPVSLPSASGASNAATAAAEPPPDRPGMRSRSHGLRVGPYAECSVDEPIANSSMFVLPSGTSAGVAQPGDDGRVVGRHPALEHPRARRRRHAARAQHVLDRDRHPGERAELLAGGAPRVDGAAVSRAASPATCRNACTSPSTAAMRSRWACVASTLDTSPDSSRAARVSRRPAAARRPARVRWPDGARGRGRGRGPAHASSPRIRGTRKRCSSLRGRPPRARPRSPAAGPRRRGGSRSSAAPGGTWQARPRRPTSRDGGDGVDDGVELTGEPVQLGVGRARCAPGARGARPGRG